MNQQTDKAILVVSFGTSYEASRKATIEKIEQDIRNAFQDHRRDPGGGCSADPYPGRYRE